MARKLPKNYNFVNFDYINIVGDNDDVIKTVQATIEDMIFCNSATFWKRFHSISASQVKRYLISSIKNIIYEFIYILL